MTCSFVKLILILFRQNLNNLNNCTNFSFSSKNTERALSFECKKKDCCKKFKKKGKYCKKCPKKIED